MNTLNVTNGLIQGTPEWHAHRAKCDNGSEAAAALGISPKIKRDELVASIATGKTREFSEWVEKNILAEGHRAEALARPLAEEIIDDMLFPVTVSIAHPKLRRPLSSSLDGITQDYKTMFEHKSLNAELSEALAAGVIPDEYHPQMEQGLMLTGATRCLFMASKWDDNGNLLEEKHAWYTPNHALRSRIIDAWAMVESDADAYVPAEVKAAPTAAPQETLPAVTVQVTGSLAVIDNLTAFGEALTAYVARINNKPETDDDFATLEVQAKQLKQAEDALTAAENGALAQASSIDEMRRAVANYREIARQARLTAEKVVKAEKENRKNAIVSKGIDALRSFRDQLSGKFSMPMSMPDIIADFHGAARGLKTLASIQNAINTELSRAKIEAQNVADKIEANLRNLSSEQMKEYAHLFADYRTLALKDTEYVSLEATRRVQAFNAEQDRKLAAERERIAKEEREKAERELAAKQEAEMRANHIRDAAQIATKPAEENMGAPLKLSGKMVEVARQDPQFTIATKTVTREEAEQLYPAADNGNRITLGDINGALEPIKVTEAFLSSLGIDPVARDKRACLYREVDFPAICRSVAAHVTSKIDAFLKVA